MESNSVCNHTRSHLITFNVPITYTYKYASLVDVSTLHNLFTPVHFYYFYYFFPSQRDASGNVTFKIVPSSRNINQVSEVRDICRLFFLLLIQAHFGRTKLYKGWVSCYVIRDESGTFWCPIHFAIFTRKRESEMKMFRCGWFE